VRAAVQTSVDVQLAAAYEGARYLERRLKSWHNTGRFCAICREHHNRLADR
jgi:hypothetical protein